MITPETMFGLIMGFLVAWVVEKYYISRVSVLPNVAAIFFLLIPYWSIIENFIKWWAYIGIITGGISLIFIINKKQLASWVHSIINYPLYSGKTIMGIYISIIFFQELLPNQLFTVYHYLLGAVFIIIVWVIGKKIFKNKFPLEN